ncbi:hypothetical protein KIN20_010750 [Parelaphostrongylus tenuis]|uniref:Uncharacterized protein n=1 Tax=Parelaphostrongylus tenuis TaxID=148309 RepID=A0AAD5QLL6_PARTN|nr:hypothetical protein KIN20_010750 [Parelaphostrongylus tenuis]
MKNLLISAQLAKTGCQSTQFSVSLLAVTERNSGLRFNFSSTSLYSMKDLTRANSTACGSSTRMILTLEKAKAQKRYPNKTSHSNPVLATTAEKSSPTALNNCLLY